MKEKIEEVREKAKRTIGDNKISTLVGEEKMLEELYKISTETNKENYEHNKKRLKEIEKYLKVKEEENEKTKDMEFLTNLAKELREQEVRIEDAIAFNIPLFKIVSENKDYYFLTRKSAQEFKKTHKTSIQSYEIIQIEKNENLELETLIRVLKDNF